MNGLTPLLGRMSSQPLLIFLAIQAALFFYNLDLLPIWGDEQFTLTVLTLPWPEAFEKLKADIHPPLYYFLARQWVKLPWPGTTITQVRALSGVFGLAATGLVYFLWFKDRRPSTKWWFLGLWTFSPALVLYCRMGRSYSMAMLLGALAIHAAQQLTKNPRSKRAFDSYPVVAALLLYTHYLPGLTIVGATAATLLIQWIRDHKRATLNALFVPHLVVFLLYAPWLSTLAQVFGRVAARERYLLLDNWAAETLLRLAYWFASFTFGETVPPWGLAAGLFLAVPVAWFVWRGASQFRGASLLLFVVVIGYIGASSWVAFSFLPARLLFLMPLYVMLVVAGGSRHPKAAPAVYSSVLVVCAGSLWSYFHTADFFNKGYLIPYAKIAHYIRENSPPQSTLVVADRYNGDPSPLSAALGDQFAYFVVDNRSKPEKVIDRVEKSQPRLIWYLRNTRDISPGKMNERLEAKLREDYSVRRHEFLEYSGLERRLLVLLGLGNAPTHYYQMLELRERH